MTMTMTAAHTGTVKTPPGVPFPLGAHDDGADDNRPCNPCGRMGPLGI